MDIRKHIVEAIMAVVEEMGIPDVDIQVTQPELSRGDYTTNIAMILASRLQSPNLPDMLRKSKRAGAIADGGQAKLGQNPLEIAEKISRGFSQERRAQIGVDKIEVVKPGFINFWLKEEVLFDTLTSQFTHQGEALEGKRYLVEYAHPNTHKEMHIGHMRTLITGEAISRLLEANGAEVFRANYQGDIGPHVAKALYGIEVLMKGRNLSLDEVDKWSNSDKAHFLGEGYVRGNVDYEAQKATIDDINNKLYVKDEGVLPVYKRTRQWSLDYYEDFYTRFYTKFDRLFFESEMVEPGKKIVMENLGKVFTEDNGAIIFPGEKYDLHTRVFITQAGNPTYEGKEMGNGFAEYEAFPFDQKIHVVASEQAGYFQVVFKALEMIAPEKFEGKQLHISMGMVNLVGRKMSSRTGEILRVDDLIDQVKDRIKVFVEEGRIKGEDKEGVSEMVAMGAIKYSVLKVGTGQNVAFDIEKSVSLEGDSGPYIQYAYARTQSVIEKSKISPSSDGQISKGMEGDTWKIVTEESDLLRYIYRYFDIVELAGRNYSPNILAEYLFDLAKLYNLFYQKHKIIGSDQEALRLALTKATGRVLEQGLGLLGIKAPEKM